MAYSALYRKQVALVVKVLPYVAKEACFALKGGTAINLFLRNLPRLSVDIDLTYLPVAGRDQSLNDIEEALMRIAQRIEAVDSSVHLTSSAPSTQQQITKLVIRTVDRVQIKVEVTPVRSKPSFLNTPKTLSPIGSTLKNLDLLAFKNNG